MNIGTMKNTLDTATRPHSIMVYGFLVLVCAVMLLPNFQRAINVIACVWCCIMLCFVGRKCDRVTSFVERSNAASCFLILCGVLVQ